MSSGVARDVVHLLEQPGDEQHLRPPLDSVLESKYRRTDAYLNTSTAPATSRHGSRGC